MPKESTYKEQMTALGIYDSAFDPSIHALCIMERELSRTMKAWKAEAPEGKAPSALSKLYPVIQSQRRDISAMRDELGLTPKGLKRLRGKDSAAETSAESIAAKLDKIAEQCESYDSTE